MGRPYKYESMFLPPGESRQVFAPAELASKIENFKVTPEGYLESVRGPADYAPFLSANATTLGRAFGIYFANLLGGAAPSLFIRAGDTMYLWSGWRPTDPFVAIATGLAVEANPAWPDQFVSIGGRVIWTNGLDHALVLGHDGSALRLGFGQTPSPPQVLGPRPLSPQEKFELYPNSAGYSWPGRIGTPGDAIDRVSGKLLRGTWYYYLQWEDAFGNLSPLSPASEPASISEITSLGTYAYETSSGATTLSSDSAYADLDELTRQFAVVASDDGPKNAVAWRIMRTADVLNVGPEPRLLARVGGNQRFVYCDAASDAELGPPVGQYLPVPVFRVMCVHGGSLVIGNTHDDAGIVMRSEPGFPGTFRENSWTLLSENGEEVTGLVSHAGRLIGFTEMACFDLTNPSSPPVTIAKGIGCAAPRSIQSLPDGSLIWLSRDGFYRMSHSGEIENISMPIHRQVVSRMHPGRIRLAVSAFDTISREYICWYTPAGREQNLKAVVFDGRYWRQLNLGLGIADVCVTTDWRRYMLGVGWDSQNQDWRVFCMDHEIADYSPPARTVVYRSRWFRHDEQGLQRFRVRKLFLGMLDSWDGATTIKFFKDGVWNPVGDGSQQVRLVGTPFGDSDTPVAAGSAQIGSDKIRDPRLFWRAVVAEGLEDVRTWAFELSASYPTVLRIGAIAVQVDAVGLAGMDTIDGRTPMALDE